MALNSRGSRGGAPHARHCCGPYRARFPEEKMKLSRRNSPERPRARWRRSLVGLVLAAAALSLAAASDAAPRRDGRGGGAMDYRGQMGRAPGGMYQYGGGRMGAGGWA